VERDGKLTERPTISEQPSDAPGDHGVPTVTPASGAPVATSHGGRRSEVLGTARSGGINFLGAAFNQTLRFGITFLLARALGPARSGLFYQAFAFLPLLLQVGAGGLKLTLTRFVAVHRADGDQGAVRGIVRLGLLISSLGATVIGVALFFASPWLADVAFNDVRLTPLLQLVAVALPATVFTDCALSATQGFKTMRPYALINLFFEPSFRLLLTAGLFFAGFGLAGAMIALVATNVVSAVLSAASLRRLMGPPTDPPRYGGLRELYSFTTVAWLTSITNSGLIWAGTIMLGLYAIPAEVGIYQVAARLVLLGTIFIQPVTTSFAPRVADLYQRGETESLRDTYVLITSWIFRLALPSFIILMVFAKELLAIFGSGFTDGTTVTVVLALAQLVNSATGPCGYMLLMSGRHSLQSINNVAALVVNIALNLWLIPRYGIVGAAVSWAVVIGGFNIVRVIQVWVFLGMLPIDRVMMKGVVAGAVGTAAAALVSAVLDGPLSLAVGVGTVGLTYFSAIVMLGIGPDDRLVLDLLRRKLGSGSA